ncbi:MAG: hypothetical protein CMP62_03930 [Flavobacteriales bacterium]|nr:hypothetical protein [Flavobacteriales bacterium]
MNFLNRFLFFCLGIFLGIILIVFSFQKRKDSISFNYFPNNRVKNYFLQSNIFFSEKAMCKIECFNLDTAFLDEYIMSSHVNFKKSKIRGHNDKQYFLSFSFPKSNVHEMSHLKFKKHNDSITLVDLFINLSLPLSPSSTALDHLHCEHCH